MFVLTQRAKGLKCSFSNISFLNFLSVHPPNIWCRSVRLFSLCCVDADLVPVRDWAHEKGLSGRELSTAPPSALPEEQAGKAEHCSMRRLRLVRHKCVSVYTVSFCMSLMSAPPTHPTTHTCIT